MFARGGLTEAWPPHAPLRRWGMQMQRRGRGPGAATALERRHVRSCATGALRLECWRGGGCGMGIGLHTCTSGSCLLAVPSTQSACEVRAALSSVSSCERVKEYREVKWKRPGAKITTVRQEETRKEMHQFQARKAVQPRQTSRVVALLHQLFKRLRREV